MNDINIFYKNNNGEISYNSECSSCSYKCKQSFRATIVTCKKIKENKKRRK